MCAEEAKCIGRLFRVLAMMTGRELVGLTDVLEEAEDLSDDELKERLAQVFESRGGESGGGRQCHGVS